MSYSNSEINSYDRLANDQAKELRNLELVASESLLRMVKELGVSESVVMVSLREDFARELQPDDDKILELIDQYLGLGQEMTAKDKRPESILAVNILLIVFSLPRQNEDIISDFYDACIDAVEMAEMGANPIAGKLRDLLNRIF